VGTFCNHTSNPNLLRRNLDFLTDERVCSPSVRSYPLRALLEPIHIAILDCLVPPFHPSHPLLDRRRGDLLCPRLATATTTEPTFVNLVTEVLHHPHPPKVDPVVHLFSQSSHTVQRDPRYGSVSHVMKPEIRGSIDALLRQSKSLHVNASARCDHVRVLVPSPNKNAE
jgi:hypothetical protein